MGSAILQLETSSVTNYWRGWSAKWGNKIWRSLGRLSVFGALLTTACETETLLNANFDADTIGATPAFQQSVGSVSLDQGAGTVRVTSSPVATESDKWVRISHPTTPSEQTAMKCELSKFGGDGTYTLLASFYIPTGAGVATVQFEPYAQPSNSYFNFFHLDFLTNGTVRIDDGSTTFGSFPRDQVFSLVVTLNISATAATASISLLGAASGSLDVNINPALRSVARQFGAVRFWMGYQHVGSFYVDDVMVLRKVS